MTDKEIIAKQKAIIMKQNVIISGMSKTLHMVALMLPSMVHDKQHEASIAQVVDKLKFMADMKDSV